MLDDADEGLIEFLGQCMGGIEIDEIVERESLSIQDLCAGNTRLARSTRAVESTFWWGFSP